MLTNQQRKIFLTYLTDQATDDWESANRFIAKDKYWLLTTDRLTVSRKDGSCSSINARLIDPIILEGLHDCLYMNVDENENEDLIGCSCGMCDDNNDDDNDKTINVWGKDPQWTKNRNLQIASL